MSSPVELLFYTNGVKLASLGWPVIDLLQAMEARGIELVLCKTCQDYFQLTDQVVGTSGGMADIVEALQKADTVIAL